MNQKAIDNYGNPTNRFFVSLPFLKILSKKIVQISQEIMSLSFDFDNLKINYFPCCLSFYHVQMGCCVLGLLKRNEGWSYGG